MFSKRLRDLRDSHNLSMDKLVELYNKRFNAKMNKSTLSRYENGTQDPIYTVVVNLAKLFNVSIDYLTGTEFSEINEIKKEDAVSDIFVRLRSDDKFLNAVQKIYSLNDEQLEAALKSLEKTR